MDVTYECPECSREWPSKTAADRCCMDGDSWDTEPMWARSFG